MVEDPYKVLGVSRDADKDEIKRAYRRKAKEYHPDLHPDDPKAAEKMNEINEAYDMINNPEKYRKQSTQGQGGSYGTYGNGSYGGGHGPYGGQNGPYGSSGSYGGGSSYGGANGPYGSQRGSNGSYGPYGGYGGFDFEDIFGFGGGPKQQPPKPSVEPQDSSDIRQAVDFINMNQFTYAAQTLNSIVSSLRDARWYYLSALTNYGLGNHIQAEEQIQKAMQMAPGNAAYEMTLRCFKQSRTAYSENGQEFQKYAEGMQKMCLGFCALQFFCMFCRC